MIHRLTCLWSPSRIHTWPSFISDIYISDIVCISPLLHVVLCVDDTTLFYSARTVNEICNVLILKLIKLSRWFKLNKLSLNIKKTNFIVFRPKNKPIEGNPNIQIDDCNIAT